MRRAIAFSALLAMAPFAGKAQKLPGLKPTLQGTFFLPVALGNPVFNDLTFILGQVDGTFQLPAYKDFGLGAGVNATWYELNDRALAQVPTEGDVSRLLFYGKLFWSRYMGPRTFFELNAKFGHSTWDWNCTTCSSNERQSGFHWGTNAALYVHASDNLAFGLSVGYQRDATTFGPGVIGLESFPGLTDTGGPYQFLTVGLGFSTSFEKAKDGMW